MDKDMIIWLLLGYIFLLYMYIITASMIKRQIDKQYKLYIKELEKSVKIYEDYVDNNEGN